VIWDQRLRDPIQQRGLDIVGAAIKRRRLALGWTQRFLEAQSGIDQTVISRIENGRQYGLRWTRFADLVAALGGFDTAPSDRRPIGGRRGPSMRHAIDLTIDSGAGIDDEDDED
jgi:transcriptional regulator with XRE-family HTH domain